MVTPRHANRDDDVVLTPAVLRVAGAAAAMFAVFLAVVTVAEIARRAIGLPPDLNLARAFGQTLFWAHISTLHFLLARERNRKDNP